jgi:uracil-DNA glycosylase family 4
MGKAPHVDPRLRRRYLHAMGVQVWRSRVGGGASSGAVTAVTPQDAAPEFDEDRTGIPVRVFGADAAGSGPDLHPPQAWSPDAPPPGPSPLSAIQRPRGAIADAHWDTLRAEVVACRACGLCETRTQTVFGVGNREADLMIIGEAPGVDEDRAGEPFVGRAGRLLNLMLAAIGLGRDQVYIANILKCHPPGNRDPSPEEALRCEPFLMHQIELVRPRLVLAVGRVSAQNLLRTGTAVGRLRGQWFEFGPDRTPLAVTYHPAYLLRSPEQKALVWQDLQRVARKLRELQNSPAGCGGGL